MVGDLDRYERIANGMGLLGASYYRPLWLLNPAWWANGLFIAGIAAVWRKRPELAGLCGIFGLLLGLVCWIYEKMPFFSLLFGDLGGRNLHLGFYLWVASFGVLACSAGTLLWPSD